MSEEYIPDDEHLMIRTIAMPRDTNPAGDIFGGWLVSQMDLAAASVAAVRAEGRAVTIAIDELIFHKPVFVGDELSCFAQLIKVGNTSMKIRVDVWVRRALTKDIIQVTEGVFTFVAIDSSNMPRKVPD